MNRNPLALALTLMAVAGCTLNRVDLRRDALVPRIGGGGQVIEPKRVALQVAILSRPIRDDAINSAVWSVADEQMIPPEARRMLEANGLRVGLITGELPAEVEKVLKAPAPHKVEPAQFDFPDGGFALISLCESTPQASLLLSREGRAFGKDYADASGWLRVTAGFEGAHDVTLRLVPEIHHGPIQHAFGALPNAGTLAPRQFMLKDGQQEETLRELAATLTLEPGQVAVIGCRPEGARSLGAFLFTHPEPNSDRLLQKLVLIWASRSSLGLAGAPHRAPADLEPVEPPK